MKKNELVNLLDSVLNTEYYSASDISSNGVQVDNNKSEIHKICFAVDACYDSIKAASDECADMLFVHHGLFWGSPVLIKGINYNRFSTLIKNDIMLYASHLPLDANMLLGNNFTMARILKLNDVQPFCEYNGVKIGAIGNSEKPYDIDGVIRALGFNTEADLKVSAFGKQNDIKRIGIVSGGAAEERDLRQAIKQGADLYITGEHSHILYHIAKEEKISVISGGHYQSETFGVKSVCDFLTKKGLICKFIDIPTGM